MCDAAPTTPSPIGKVPQESAIGAGAALLLLVIVPIMHTSALPTGASAPLSAVLATEEFLQRPTRAPDYEAESRALAALAQELSSSPTCILQKLVEASLDLCRAHSSGISLLDEQDGERIFRWPAIAGVWAPHVGGTTPRDFSPCGVVLDRNSMQLFVRSDRYYSYFGAVTRPAYEALLIPFSVGGEAVGTVWVVSHDESRHFDLEDYRLLSSVGKFASAAFGLLASVEGRKQPDAELRQSEERARLALEVAQLGTWSWSLTPTSCTRTRAAEQSAVCYLLRHSHGPTSRRAFIRKTAPESRRLSLRRFVLRVPAATARNSASSMTREPGAGLQRTPRRFLRQARTPRVRR